MDISRLVEVINNDLKRDGSYDRYPIRFFSLKYEVGTCDAIIRLQKELDGVDIFDIKDILPHEDGWITADTLRTAVEELNPSKSFIVIGFSEYARFLGQEEFISLLITFLELENSSGNRKRRIYFPCFALYSQIKKTIRAYHRRIDVYNPLLNETDIEDLPRIFFIEGGLAVDCHSNEVVNSAEWFGMWRNSDIDIDKPIICLSKTLAHFYTVASPDNVYNIQHIKTYQDILQYFYSIDKLSVYKKDSDGFYSQLIELIKAYGRKTLSEIILSEINAQSIDARNVYNLWKVNDTFKRWLIQNYVLDRFSENTYLYKVMLLLEDLSDKEFLEKTYEGIFEFKKISLVEERKQILAAIKRAEKDIVFSNRMITYYNMVMVEAIRKKTATVIERIDFTKDDEIFEEKKDVLIEVLGEEIIPYLTCYSSYERQLIVWLYRMKFINESQVRDIYPSLWDYFSSNESDIEPDEYFERFNKYFKIYREVRLAQKEGADYNAALEEWNKNENAFYDWYINNNIEYPEVYLKKKIFNGNIYVLDGVGAEFMGYILNLLQKRGFSAESLAYGKSHLPSTTTVAKEFYPPEYKWLSDYDKKVVHDGPYYHVTNIEKALSVIENLIDDIILTEGEETFAITADHGSTVGHKLWKKEKKYNFDKSEHDGRCYYNKDRQYINKSNDYVIYDDEMKRQWVIALNQQSLYNNSQYAVHGGATLEEVLVPVIIVQRNKQIVRAYKVQAINLEVSGLQKKVEFKIIPEHKDVKPLLKAKDGTNTELTYSNDTKLWIGELERGIEQDIEVIVDKKTFKFRTVTPTKMGDDLFDD